MGILRPKNRENNNKNGEKSNIDNIQKIIWLAYLKRVLLK
jgi:hypothetical protein